MKPIGALLALLVTTPCAAAEQPRNLVLFVADGSATASLPRRRRRRWRNCATRASLSPIPHSLFPTFTTANASAMATGHYLGDTGDYSKRHLHRLSRGRAGPGQDGDAVPGERSRAGRRRRAFRRQLPRRGDHPQGGPRQGHGHGCDRQARARTHLRLDGTGWAAHGGHRRPDGFEGGRAARRLGSPGPRRASLAPKAPGRGQPAGTFETAGTLKANLVQQDWFTAATTQVVLPRFKAEAKGSRSSTGRATPMGRSTTRATAWAASRLVSTARRPWPRSATRMPTSPVSRRR